MKTYPTAERIVPRAPDQVAGDVAAASAACLGDDLAVIAALTPREQFEWLRTDFEAAIGAYRDALNGWND